MSENGNGKNVMDLDALFGVQEPLTIKWQGQEYPIVRLDALDLREMMRFQALAARIGELRRTMDTLPETDLTALADTLEEVFTVIAPTLPSKGVPPLKQLMLLDWYFNENKGFTGDLEKKMNRKQKRTMEKSSRRSRSGITSVSTK